ncbi:PREDICTED: uncharacterized protein LOC109188622 [Ipomoea nil]|uniref:uncharacterized protein LOC109188622 n=1 Tax=Ipomoea nil TaxID=35883 RepID=UPI000901D348|nr:PREDICTED: uncharacterized protein LOC109188622 [Ipomoea nil]
MSILSWNCRGLGGTRTVRELLGIVSKERPFFVFLMETKANVDKVEQVRVKMGFEGAVNVDRVGLGGGLALLWRDAKSASLLSFSNNHIDMEVTLPGRPKWRLTDFYSNPERSKRHITWDLLRKLKHRSSLPWVVVGYFNDIAFLSEKRGDHSHPDAIIECFNDALSDYQLNDLGMLGDRFTWEKSHGTEAWVEERLDRAVASINWVGLHEEAAVRKIFTVASDHSAIFHNLETRLIRAARSSFKFESAWLLNARCAKEVEAACSQTIEMGFR